MHYKYPRTFHIESSPGLQNDDRKQEDYSILKKEYCIYSEKMDGENTNLYPDRYHARSIDSKDHPSRHYVKGLWGSIKHMIPEGWRICGENCFAKHSIYYENLDSYFYVIGIYNEKNYCLDFLDTMDCCNKLGLVTVPILHMGYWNDEMITKTLPTKIIESDKEGFVIRTAKSFHYDDFNKHVVKWVRANHVQPNEGHWMSKAVVPNKLKK